MLAHKGTVKLETERLILRKFDIEDAEDMFNNWASDNDVTKHLTWSTHKDIETSKKVISMWESDYGNPEYYQWAIEIKETSQVVGDISFLHINNNLEMCEIGYCIGKKYWNKGIVTEAFKELIRFSFHEIKFNRITGRHHTDNPASGKVMEKCALKYEGLLRQVIKNSSGDFVDCNYYSILKEEYDDPIY